MLSNRGGPLPTLLLVLPTGRLSIEEAGLVLREIRVEMLTMALLELADLSVGGIVKEADRLDASGLGRRVRGRWSPKLVPAPVWDPLLPLARGRLPSGAAALVVHLAEDSCRSGR